MTNSFILHNLSHIVTLAPLVNSKIINPLNWDELGLLSDGWVQVAHGKIANIGHGSVPASLSRLPLVDGKKMCLFPGLIDSHTHLLFAGSRANEFCMRLEGRTYEEIANAGGGIQSTVQATNQTSDEDLLNLCQERLKVFLSYGTTSLEVKTGYALDVEQELRHLRIYQQLKKQCQQLLSITCLALHAIPKNKTKSDFIFEVKTKLIPAIQSENLADSFDAFIENGYYSVADIEPLISELKERSIALRFHADEFSDAGAALAAAKWGAQSADHLQFASADAIAAMAKAKVVATLLPATSFYTKINFTDAKKFVDAGVHIAIASDFNPGSAHVLNLAFVATLASLYSGVKPATAIAACTYNAAKSLGIEKKKGAIEIGFDADFFLHPAPHPQDWIADCGQTPPKHLWIKGVKQF